MRTIRIILISMFFFLNSFLAAGCWNYREIDQLAVVAGVAIDKGKNEKFTITVEIVETTSGKEQQTKSKTVTIEGKTIFDAVRHEISLIGKRIYWSHAKVVIISKEIARDGILEVIDWFNRDAETRSDIHILVSKEKSAREILNAKGPTEEVTSFLLDDVITNERSVSNAPHIEVWRFTNSLAAKGVGTIAGAVDLKEENGQSRPHIMGTAIFKDDRLMGFIDGDETKYMLFIQDEVKGGVLVEEINSNGGKVSAVTLEIFKSHTKVNPAINDGKVEMKIEVEVSTAIDELGSTINFIEDEGRMALEEMAEKSLKKNIEGIIKKVQTEYGVDIFGFGTKLKEEKNKEWKTISGDWEENFKQLKVNVETKINIKNSAMLSKPLEIGD
ncbi:Ger(x)C family spore germination protein [Pseudobacteroides cellulosolvens]|uniref:Germination protein, Ger(X)C family n=1 Tax=Pseudobacteroides cellulosolvens ATCC 35603 = DSM 2933 TaxID=398512 RepID=A0A0L6JKC7_9FIRM|nr:Ger(x)C family spore germination protein [Pseudobacteroides cellulosolvens]KNY25827.1 germination protein, Ger(x)C family [Pseudobacteroides cellulosolvens ATCC 35603 = DSM 2933]